MKKPEVLICDDQEECRVVLEAVFKSAGADVICVASGKEVLATIDKKSSSDQFSLIVLDIRMPDMPGTEVSKAIRDQGFNGKIIALTAAVEVGQEEGQESSGIDSYYSKNVFNIARAKELLNQLCS